MTFYDRYGAELYHHGVKGMKWGVRKSKPASNKRRIRRAKRTRTLNKMEKVRKELGKKKTSSFSEQLKINKDINRLNKNYVRNSMIGSAICSSLMAGPELTLSVYTYLRRHTNMAPRKRAIVALSSGLGAVAVSTLASGVNAKVQQEETKTKYGI